MTTDHAAAAHRAADELFDRYASAFGADLDRYRGHVHRVIGLVDMQVPIPDDAAGPLGLAAFFHDSAIWFDRTWDYLPQSVRRAVDELPPDAVGYSALVSDLIGEHHRIRPTRCPDPLIEAFRRADLTDVSAGLVASPGVPRSRYRALVSDYPSKGFRPMLVRAFGRGLKKNPLHPLPMVKR